MALRREPSGMATPLSFHCPRLRVFPMEECPGIEHRVGVLADEQDFTAQEGLDGGAGRRARRGCHGRRS